MQSMQSQVKRRAEAPADHTGSTKKFKLVADTADAKPASCLLPPPLPVRPLNPSNLPVLLPP